MILYFCVLGRRLVVQDETSKCHQSQTDCLTMERRMLNHLKTSSQQRALKEINALKLLSLKKTSQKLVPALLSTF